jgi:S-adenosylmethionine:tRNA ribosyltransferase-isomerase
VKLSEFNYTLPKELIAQYPARKRDACRLMVLDRRDRSILHKTFDDLAGYFKEGDCLVLNDTRVIPARLFGKRKTGGKVELFLLENKNPICEALVRPSARLKEGEKISLESGAEAEVLNRGEIGRFVKFDRPIEDILKSGHTPLPPYIDRPDTESDKKEYQTVFAAKDGATASPTAGLHFTHELLNRISESGVTIAYVTLHTSYGTFAPVKDEDVEKHTMHREYFELPEKAARVISETKKIGGKIFAVGTTGVRVLEHCLGRSAKGYTDLYIYPGYNFKIVDHMITNFHLPKSTLLLLVSAFAGKGFILEAYRNAIEERYRFFSYGDAMLIL